MTTRRFGPVAAAVFVLAAAAAGVIGALIYNGTQDSGMIVGSGVAAPTAIGDTPSSGAPPPLGGTAAPDQDLATPPAVFAPTAVPEPTVVALRASADVDDAMLEAALIEAASSPLQGLPGLDEIATVRLEQALLTAGYDLAGLEVSIYPASSAESMLVLETSDATPLLASEAGESFVTDLLDSPIVAEYEVDRLVLRHNTVDEVGAAVRVTMTVPIAEFRNAIDSGGDAFSLFAVQTEPR